MGAAITPRRRQQKDKKHLKMISLVGLRAANTRCSATAVGDHRP
jgi:hypothetical protein